MLDYEHLVARWPDAAHCAFCGKQNDYWDELGPFYLWIRPEMEFEDGQPTCKECDEGAPGQRHRELHKTVR